MQLSVEAASVRKLLIAVARGEPISKRLGRVSYKEVWQHVYPTTSWGMAYTWQVVDWITKISALEIQVNRPPLNEIVTPTNKLVPTESWVHPKTGIRAHLKVLSGVLAPYASHEEAQAACWTYWSNHAGDDVSVIESHLNEDEVDEGYFEDRQVTFRHRNRRLIAQAIRRDGFKCQACAFELSIDGRPIIDCHHTIPLSHTKGGRVTKLIDLVSLCPTCHRIAHSKRYPLNIEQIRKYRGLS